MRGEIIAIGDELTTGRILNSTSCFAAGRLFAAGYEVPVLTTISDDLELISENLLQALARSDFVIVTGGLGTTSDDLTNEAVSAALARPTTFYPEILRKIQAHSEHLSPRARASLEKLAWLPDGAHALHSEAKSAGYFLVHEGKPVFFLPGVPHEMRELMVEAVLPRLTVWDGKPARRVRQRVYRVSGPGEAEINQRLADLEDRDERVRIGYYPVSPEVQVSLTISAGSRAEADKLLADFDREIKRRLGHDIYGLDEDSLEEVVGKLCRERGLRLAVAESCSGGLIAAAITRVPGSSDYFVGGVVAYSNELKEKLLGVAGGTLTAQGAVSGAVAKEMASGIRRLTGADLALSVTGIAGPGGGSDEKPVGTVYVGLATASGVRAELFTLTGKRGQIQETTAHRALDLLRRQLLPTEDSRPKGEGHG
ncbi:CinA family nicotinamide mononucleotide deamidase-related protein [Desulfurivibrio dismutans]|uniref:CinA family nicotinamide mononucleotide deamidase-related protein n=1 Tax=Desulfurivibrio dismutans TaxID=1398908 RepID=UPI0023DABE4B|nr:CinA family nicotinamide mononucleotide deamidase-related protein [Desulfurivibrio alkaliphilus]MDF1615614.1 CinA family nicotinamide mononucleotide deamidase-related protein [Desulfurivibrio alkaliphilus]